MMQMIKKSTLLVSAFVVTISMIFMSFGLLTAPTYAEGNQTKEKICFDGDSDYDWAHFYIVDGKTDTLTKDGLNITLLDEDDNEFDSNTYDLSVQYTYYDEEQNKDVSIPVDEPFGITEGDMEFGYSEYIATATFKEGSGYEGCVEGHFIISDKHSLLFACAEINAQGFVERKGWRMHDRYVFESGDDIEFKVRHSGTEEWLEEGTNYSITYYRISNPEEMDNPEIDFRDFLAEDHPVEGVPTEDGTYFAKVKGIDPYYGEADVIIDIDKDGAEYNYNLPGNVNMLPQDLDWIDAEYSAWIRNKDYPDGNEFNLKVTDARIENPTPADVITLAEEDGGGWRIEANKMGSANIILTYTDYDDSSKEHSFTVNVSDTVYDVNMWSADEEYHALPGSSIELEASATKRTAKPSRENPGDWDHRDIKEGLGFKWSLGEGSNEWAILTPNKDDPSKATLTFKDMPEGWDHIRERVDVCVGVIDKNSDDSEEVRRERWEDFWVCDEYLTIAPGRIDSSLDLGKTDNITPELRRYKLGEEGFEVIDAEFSFEDYNPDVIDVTKEGDTFSYTRKEQYDTNFRIIAEWDQDEEPIERWYRLDEKWYDIYFPYGDIDIYNDNPIKLELEKNDLDNLITDIDNLDNTDYRIEYTVGRWNDDDEIWEDVLGPEYYEADSSGITLDYAKAKEQYSDGFSVEARLYLGEERPRSNAHIWVNLRNACVDEHHWIKGTVKQATCQEKGKEIWVCLAHHLWDGCGEVRVVETDIVPHDLTKVAAKEATVDAEGNTEYYRCSMCDRLFSDAAAENEIDPESVIVAKKIDIANATVAKIADVKYNKKAQTPALTVKMGETVLNLGADYSVKYTDNTNVGTAKATITGLGKYGGSQTASFKIVKAANPAKFTPKAVTVKYSAVSKKNQTVKLATACKVTGAQGKVTWKKASGNAKIVIATNGNITVKKGIKKGTYKLVVNATAAGNANYNKLTKKLTITIKVK